MTSFLSRVVERARSPHGTLQAPAAVPPLELDTQAGEAAPEAATRELPSPEGVALRAAPTLASPLRDAGVRAVAPVRSPGAAVAEPRAPRAPSAELERGPAAERTTPGRAPANVPELAATALPAVTPELERRWRDLGQRLLAAHPPASSPAERYPGAAAATGPEPGAPSFAERPRQGDSITSRREVDAGARPERDLPEARFVATRGSPRNALPARAEVTAPSDVEPEVVIQNLEVTVAAPRAEPEPPRQRSRSPERGGAWSVVARRYLTRI